MMRFQHAEYLWWLWLILPLLALYAWYRYRQTHLLRKMGDAHIVRQQLIFLKPRMHAYRFICWMLALFSGIVGLANLQTAGGTSTIQRKGIDIMIALDVSKSMLAKDISPNRLEKAKQMISKLLEKIGNNRIGLVVFAGRAYVSVPLTVDMGALKMNLSTIEPSAIPTQGTVLGKALAMSMGAFQTKDLRYKSIILISDGEDHDEEALTQAKQANEAGVIVHTVGVGSPEGAPIFDETTQANKTDADGHEIITILNESLLQDLAETGNGTYIRLQQAEQVANHLANEINSMEKRNMGDAVLTNYKSYYQYFLCISLGLLMIESLLTDRKKKLYS